MSWDLLAALNDSPSLLAFGSEGEPDICHVQGVPSLKALFDTRRIRPMARAGASEPYQPFRSWLYGSLSSVFSFERRSAGFSCATTLRLPTTADREAGFVLSVGSGGTFGLGRRHTVMFSLQAFLGEPRPMEQ